LAKSLLKIQISLFLNSLSVLQSLDEFHFKFLHLGNFIHLDVPKLILTITSLSMVLSSHHHFSSLFFLKFHLSKSLRLKANLVFHLVFLLYSEVVLSLLLLILLSYHFSLFCFFFFLQQKCILNFLLFIITLLGYHIVILAQLSFLFIIKLNIKDFLLDFLFISLFKPSDVISSLLGFFDLLPRFHFFLFEQSDSICQQLSISINIFSSFLNIC